MLQSPNLSHGIAWEAMRSTTEIYNIALKNIFLENPSETSQTHLLTNFELLNVFSVDYQALFHFFRCVKLGVILRGLGVIYTLAWR